MPSTLTWVDPVALAAAAKTFETSYAQLDSAVVGLAAELDGCAAMAGTCESGTKWAAQYDPAAQSTLAKLNQLAVGLDKLGFSIAVTAVNHACADGISIVPGQGQTGYVLPSDVTTWQAVAPLCVARPPTAAGHSSGGPPGWSTVEHLVGYAWPDGHQDKLRTAGSAWARVAGVLVSARPTAAYGPIERQTTPETDAMLGYIADLDQTMQDLADTCRQLGRACAGMASALDDVHHRIIVELAELAAWTAGIEAVSFGLGLITGGLAEGPGQAAEASRIAKTANTIKTLIETLGYTIETLMDGIADATVAVSGASGILDAIQGIRITRAAFDAIGAIPTIAAVTRVGNDVIVADDISTTVLDGSGRILDQIGDSGVTMYSKRAKLTNVQAAASGTQIPATMDSVEAIAQRYGLDLSVARIDIAVTADDMRSLDFHGAAGSALNDHILIGPAAFISEEELARTVVHELVHVLQYFAGQVTATSDDVALETEAYKAEAEFWKEYGG